MKDEIEKELKNLMLLALNGDSTSYEAFLTKTCFVLKSFLSRIMSAKQRSRVPVEDLVQDTLLTIHRKRDLFEKEMAVLPWIYAIARHRMIDVFRAEARRPQGEELNYEAELQSATQFLEHAPDTGESLLEGLGESQKKILLLAKVEELSIAEISEVQKMSPSAVKVSIHRSLKLIRKNLEKAANGEKK